jgi:hypothetical protein
MNDNKSTDINVLLSDPQQNGDDTVMRKTRTSLCSLFTFDNDTLFTMSAFFIVFIVLTHSHALSIFPSWLSLERRQLVLGIIGSILMVIAFKLKEKYRY